MRECAQCLRCFDDSVAVCPDDGGETAATVAGPQLLNGRYLLQSFVGASSLGRTYLAEDENLVGRNVVVRLLDQPQTDSGSLARLAGRIAAVQNQNVVEIADHGAGPNGSFYVVTELVPAKSLHQLIRSTGKLKMVRAVGLLGKIADGVEAIHAHGLLHGALNPNNVFVETRYTTLGDLAGEETVKIGDFGWNDLRTIDTTSSDGEPVTGRVALGTVEYLAPEQVQPDRPIDQKADVYGLGALAYYILSGRPPFAGDLMQIVVQKTMNDPPALGKVCPELPEQIADLVTSALSRDVSQRPASISTWMEELESVSLPLEPDFEDGPPEIVFAAPAGTTVFLDDEEQGDVDGGGRFSLLVVQPGVHIARVRYADGQEQERLLEVPSTGRGGQMVVEFPLEEKPDGDKEEDGAPQAAVPSADRPPAATADPGSDATELNAVCEKCGANIRATAKFCRSCGTPVVPKPPAIPLVPTGELGAEAPSPIAPPAELPKHFVDTMDSVGGAHFEVPVATAEPPAPAEEPEPRERPKTVESPVAEPETPTVVITAQPPAKPRPNSFYLMIGGLVGLILLVALSLIGFAVYWFNLLPQ